jgi:putative membrane protein
MRIFDQLGLVAKGTAIGVANIIPGVSGGTMAVLLGLYDRLLEAIGGVLTDGKRRWEHLVFLGSIGLGAAIGIGALSHILKAALMHHPEMTYLFFAGLILGSLPAVIRESGLRYPGVSNTLWIGFGVAVVLVMGSFSGLKDAVVVSQGPVDLLKVFFCMIAAGGAMIVPGVSGSLTLILLGQYATVLGAIAALTGAIPAVLGGDFGAAGQPEVLQSALILMVAAAGAALGVWLFSKIIHFLLRKSPQQTHSFIIGLVGGSILVVFRGFPASEAGWLFGALIFLAGVLLAAWSGAFSKS